MDMRYIVPTEVPASEHPYAGLFLGVVPEGRESAVARHVFDELGARLCLSEPEEVSVGWAVEFATKSDRLKVMVGEPVEFTIPGADRYGVRLVKGHLPPGITLNRHDGTLSGCFTKPGVYDATFALGPAVKLDPLGGTGSPGEPVRWIPIGAARMSAVSETPVPATLDGLSALELSQLAAEAMRLERIKALEEAERGY